MLRYILLSTLIIVVFTSCNQSSSLFEKISSEHSGIHFNNLITETDSVNVMDFENVYNGGGVGFGDFNKDGLQDIYFAGNQVSNKLYLNQGDFKFEDITETAGITGNGIWARGVSVIDINNDGWEDVYVCASIKDKPADRQNLLYINQGLDQSKKVHFKEMAAEYGLNDDSHSTMATFFDYDNDGDVDVFIAVNEIVDGDYPNRYRPRLLNGEHANTDRLYQNNWSASLKHPVFTNVSRAAGILIEGYSHNAVVTDINKDGWKDIYVSNDYLSNNVLYINNHNGTFTDKVTEYFKHTAANAMGSDITDLNNDGLVDLVELDMNPEDNFRKKMMMNANSYQTYQNTENLNYQYQYVRNMLQVNQGPRMNQNDSIGDPIFSETSFFSGIAQTDWSWTPLVTDFDNDGFRDLIITNGFPKDVTDHDFITFRNKAYTLASKKELLEQIPQVKIPNYAFHNNGDLTFANTSKDWGFVDPSFSNGAAYADLDNDGDMDMVTNNINDEAFLFRNTSREKSKEKNHFLQVKLKGDSLNREGLGAWVELHYAGQQQVFENTPYRGYLSSIQNIAHFGLGSVSVIDSVLIKWPDGKMQLMRNVKPDRVLTVDIRNAKADYNWPKDTLATRNLFTDVTGPVNIHYKQEERDFVDFNIQKLLPHKFSEYGPALAVGDLDGDGLDDMVSGGAAGFSGQLFFQKPGGRFIQKELVKAGEINTKRCEDLGMLVFDADGDGDLDIYAASGGYESERNTSVYQDQLYLNDGKGEFKVDVHALPQNFTSKSCVRSVDFDKDGDLDLFVAGRVDPWNYPKPVSSFIFRNDSKPGHCKFTDVSATVAKDLANAGLVCDAVFTDFDNDGWQDLILAGEWMPVTFLKNEKGIFKNTNSSSGINEKLGWWNSIAPGDFDNDGDIDYIVGNMGSNSFYKGNEKYPAYITAKDFDNNGSYDAIPSLFLPDQEGELKEFPAQTRDDLVKQMIGMRTLFQNYRTYAVATMDQVIPEEQRGGALRFKMNYTSSAYLKNEGKGKFSLTPLPLPAQISALNGMVVDDVDHDGNLDVVINGNDYGTEVSVGRYDALNGLALKGDGKGNFKALSILESGIFIPGNGKALVKLTGANNGYLLAASQNRGELKVFSMKKNTKNIPAKYDDVSAIVKFKDGRVQKRELYYGASFLSQSGRFVSVDDQVSSVVLINSKAEKRNINK